MKSGIYRKIVISFFIVIIIYTVLAGTIIIKNTMSTRELDWKADSRYFLEQTSNTLDTQLTSAIKMTQVLLETNSVQELQASNGITNYGIYADVYDDISKQQRFESNYFIAITPKYDKKIISTNGYFNFDDYIKFIGLNGQLNKVKKFFLSTDTSEIGLFESSKQVTLIQDMKQNGKDIFFLVTWQKASIWPQNFPDEHSKFDMIDTEHVATGSKIAAEFPKAIKLSNKGFSKGINADDSKKGNNQLGYFQRSDVIPTIVYGYTSSLDFTQGLHLSILLPLIGYFIILLGLGAALMVYFSHKNYKPYKQIISEMPINNPTMDVNDLLDNIHLLVEENDQLSQFQSEISDDVKESFFRKLLSEKYSTKELQKLLGIIKLDDLSDGGVVAILTLTNTTSLSQNSQNESKSQWQKNMSSNILEELNRKFEKSVVLSLTLTPLQYVLIIPHDVEEYTKKRFTTESDYLRKHFSVKVKFTISLPFKDLYHFQEIFADTYKASKENDFNEISLTKKSDIQYPVEIESMIIQNAKAGNFSECSKLVQKLLVENLMEQKIDLSLIFELKFLMLNTIKRILTSNGIKAALFFDSKSDSIRLIRDTTDPTQIIERVTEPYEEMFTFIKNNKHAQVKMDKQVIEFINTHYSDDISLSYVADEFSLSESYLSKVIKNYLGISFKVYVNNLRILEAKRLLKESHLQVNEISIKVGYSNVNTFIRVFKQTEGITPGKFQQQNSERK